MICDKNLSIFGKIISECSRGQVLEERWALSNPILDILTNGLTDKILQLSHFFHFFFTSIIVKPSSDKNSSAEYSWGVFVSDYQHHYQSL